MTTRRKILLGLGLGTLSAAIPTLAQQPTKVWRVGFLSDWPTPTVLDGGVSGAFMKAMRELGYVEGKNLVIEWRFSDGEYKRFPDLAAELVRLRVDVIVVMSTPAAVAAKKATMTIPIVMAYVGDPVGTGLVTSLASPGGNVTGLSMQLSDLQGKYLGLMRNLVPKLTNIGFLGAPDLNLASVAAFKSLQAAGQKTGVTVLPIHAKTPEELEYAFSILNRKRAGAVVVFASYVAMTKVAGAAIKYRLPSITNDLDFVRDGILMSYSQESAEFVRRAATYVDKIFKGAKPSDLPIEQPTKFSLLINGKTAKALGLTLPPELLLQADEVIE